jgi:hypothetical protein
MIAKLFFPVARQLPPGSRVLGTAAAGLAGDSHAPRRAWHRNCAAHGH